ncbi:MAG: hypothetical protein P8X57_04585 [Cyclobacteriaceae bacterium]
MKEDIRKPAVKNVRIAVAHRTNELNRSEWSVYLLNMNEFSISHVLVSSKGYGDKNGESEKTSVLRHYFEEIGPQSSVMIELIQPEVFHLNNEYWVSYYHEGQIHDKKFIFLPDTIQEENLQ